MAKGVQFTQDAAARIAAVVRQVEGTGPVTSRPPRARTVRPSRASIWQVTAINAGAETCTIKRINTDDSLVDPSERTDVKYDPDNPVALGDRVILLRHADGDLCVFQGGGADPGYQNNSIGNTSEQDEALTDSWTRSFGPVGNTITLIKLYRFAYNPAGDQKLYAFYRDEVLDSLGLYSVSIETRVTIDTPVVCW